MMFPKNSWEGSSCRICSQNGRSGGGNRHVISPLNAPIRPIRFIETPVLRRPRHTVIVMAESDASPAGFYDELAEDYHLIFNNWDESIRRQAHVISRLLRTHGTDVHRVLDASCGICTQTLGLAREGFEVTASDISPESVARCAREASARGLTIRASVADLRTLDHELSGRFDAVVSLDNALPHLLADEDLSSASSALRHVLRPGGLLSASIRDYDRLLIDPPGGDPPKTFKTATGERIVFQVWEWQDDIYTVRHFILDSEDGSWGVSERRPTYRALRRDDLTPRSSGSCRTTAATTGRSFSLGPRPSDPGDSRWPSPW
jgi:glycine/sarcosine N-methyltransferase